MFGRKNFPLLAAVLGTLGAVALQIFFGLHAGALWRDEVTSVEIASMSSWGETWDNLAFESFPALFVALLRFVAGVPHGASDAELRVFGVVIGLLLLALLWVNARWLRFGLPLLSLALVGFNPMVVRYGDSIRAYGLGMVVILFALGAFWRLTEKLSLGRVFCALAAALLSVQCLYYNAFLLGAICLGAVTVALRRRDFRTAGTVVALGALAAVSLLPYLPRSTGCRRGVSSGKRRSSGRLFPRRRQRLSARRSAASPGFGWRCSSSR